MGNPRHKDWREQVCLFRESGLTQNKWCEQSGTNLHNLRYWLRKEQDERVPTGYRHSETSWMPLQIIEESVVPFVSAVAAGTITIRIGEASIAVEPGFSQQHLLQVLQTVREL